MAFFTQLLLLALGVFLIIVILLQRGRGGGLAGAFGGLGGQSAFGTKAGDVFTKITVVIAVAWVIVAGGSGYFLRAGSEQKAQGLGDPNAGISAPDDVEADPDFDPDPDMDKFTPPADPQSESEEVPASDADDESADGDAVAPGADESTAPAPEEADAPASDDASEAPSSN